MLTKLNCGLSVGERYPASESLAPGFHFADASTGIIDHSYKSVLSTPQAIAYSFASCSTKKLT